VSDTPVPTAPRTARGERTAGRLRAAAREAFAELGYAAARVEDVVAVAGVSHGTFYTYYENKAAVLDALVDETAAGLLGVTRETWDGDDVPATVEAVIGRFVDVILRDADVIATWLEAAAHEAHFRDRLREVRERVAGQVAVHLAPLERAGHDPNVVAGALVAMVEGYATRGLLAAGEAEREAAVATLARIWVGGLLHLAGDA
jgi:AcrR family transcriptional regulator